MEKVYTPEVIQETPFPLETSELVGATDTSSGDVYSPNTVKENTVRTQKVATQLLSTALNTNSRKILQEFDLEQSGGLKMGNYKEGETGEIALTPNGITAKDIAGLVTFALNALTGDAVFKGSVQAGSIITGLISVGNDTWVIDGNPDNPILALYEGGVPNIVLGELG